MADDRIFTPDRRLSSGQDAQFGVNGFTRIGEESLTVTFVDGGTVEDTVTRAAGSWIDDGFVVGDTVTFADAANAANNDTFTVTGVAALTLTVSTISTMVDEAAVAITYFKTWTPLDEQGFFYALKCLSAATFATCSAYVGHSLDTGDTLAAGDVLYGKFGTVKLSAGTVLAYRARSNG